MSLLSINNLTLRFGGLVAVNQISLKINEGEIFSVIGPNGAGKTSLFNAISGVFLATSGSVCINNREPCRPFNVSTGLSLAVVGFIAGLAALVGFNIIGLWRAVIDSRFVFGAAFDWSEAALSAISYLYAQPLSMTLAPFLCATSLFALGGYRVWLGARRGSEVCAQAGISRTFQNVRLFPNLSALDNVLIGMHSGFESGFWASLLRVPALRREEQRAKAFALQLLKFVELDTVGNASAGGLPYGSQRRLEIARALSSRPRVLLLDEPAAGMNPSESKKLMNIIRAIKTRPEFGCSTVVLIEHDMKVVMGISDRIAVMHYGNKIAEGTPAEIRANPAVIEAYLGSAV